MITLSGEPGGKTAYEHFSYGKVYLDQGEYDNAIAEFTKAVSLEPDNGDFLINLAKGHFAKKDYNQALKYFEKAGKIAPDYADSHYFLGCTCMELDMKDRAINEFKESLNINPRYTAAKRRLSRLMRTIDKTIAGKDYAPEGETVSEEEKQSRQANIHYHLGNALLQKNLLQEALLEYKEALRLRPSYPDIRNKMGELYMKRGLYTLAEEEFKLALKINPRYVTARINLAETYRLYSEKLLDLAEEQYRKVLEIDPENLEAKSGVEKVRSIKNLDFV
ncbi:MAG: tetratricopeptide repeat protein [bacterium]